MKQNSYFKSLVLTVSLVLHYQFGFTQTNDSLIQCHFRQSAETNSYTTYLEAVEQLNSAYPDSQSIPITLCQAIIPYVRKFRDPQLAVQLFEIIEKSGEHREDCDCGKHHCNKHSSPIK